MKFLLVTVMIIIAFAIMSDKGRLMLEVLTSVALSTALALTLMGRYQSPQKRGMEKPQEEKQRADD
ncbi:TPA: hypothetical protein ENG04_04975 [Candidatus Poribacteria bacterium]|nr:hypothetical protein [Candidatus Poribacteria bacterium]HEX29415.1 hypothetical protein [Candidatus Poribacteria bacterium]